MHPKLRPVEKLSAEAQATKSLRDHILSGSLPPGTRLKEIQLAEEMHIARATLRTSLMRLRDEGIVVQIPYTGWQVMQLAPKDVWELWTLRGSLESLAAKLTTDRMDAGIEARIEGALDALKSACAGGDVVAASEADFALHRTIIECADHGRLEEQYRQVEQQVRFYIATSNLLTAGNLPSIVVQHDPLIDAILSRDVARAASEAWAHNESEGGKLVASLRRQKRGPSEA